MKEVTEQLWSKSIS